MEAEAVRRTAHNPAPRPSVVVDTNIPAVSVAGEARRMCILGVDAWRRVVGVWRRVVDTHAKAKLDVAVPVVVVIDFEERTKPDSSLGEECQSDFASVRSSCSSCSSFWSLWASSTTTTTCGNDNDGDSSTFGFRRTYFSASAGATFARPCVCVCQSSCEWGWEDGNVAARGEVASLACESATAYIYFCLWVGSFWLTGARTRTIRA